MDEIRAGEIVDLLRGRMGLVIGPSITKQPNSLDEVNVKIAEQAQIKPQETYIATSDALLEKGISESQLKASIRDAVDHQKMSSVLSHLAKLRWATVISASLDSHFDDSFRAESDRRGIAQTITEINDLLISP